jgi:transketolase
VHLAVGAYEALAAEGIPARVVSLPSWALFDRQDQAYRDSVLPPAIQARVAIEQGSTLGWARYAPLGAIIGMSTFGASAPLKELQVRFGFTPDTVLTTARDQIARHG